MHKLDFLAIVTQAAGLSFLAADTTFQANLTVLFGPSSPKIVAIVGLVGVLASTVLRIAGAPSTKGVTK